MHRFLKPGPLPLRWASSANGRFQHRSDIFRPLKSSMMSQWMYWTRPAARLSFLAVGLHHASSLQNSQYRFRVGGKHQSRTLLLRQTQVQHSWLLSTQSTTRSQRMSAAMETMSKTPILTGKPTIKREAPRRPFSMQLPIISLLHYRILIMESSQCQGLSVMRSCIRKI